MKALRLASGDGSFTVIALDQVAGFVFRVCDGVVCCTVYWGRNETQITYNTIGTEQRDIHFSVQVSFLLEHFGIKLP